MIIHWRCIIIISMRFAPGTRLFAGVWLKFMLHDSGRSWMATCIAAVSPGEWCAELDCHLGMCSRSDAAKVQLGPLRSLQNSGLIPWNDGHRMPFNRSCCKREASNRNWHTCFFDPNNIFWFLGNMFLLILIIFLFDTLAVDCQMPVFDCWYWLESLFGCLRPAKPSFLCFNLVCLTIAARKKKQNYSNSVICHVWCLNHVRFFFFETYSFCQFLTFSVSPGPCRSSLALVPGPADALRGKPRVSQRRGGCLRSKQSVESGGDPAANPWIGLRENLQESLSHGKIYGFRLRCSLKPIHWAKSFEISFGDAVGAIKVKITMVKLHN